METVQATIDNVFVKNLPDGRPIYRAIVGDREYTTLKKSIAEQAKELVGRQAEIAFTYKPGNPREGGGTWPANYYLESVLPIPIQGNGGFTTAPAPPADDEREQRIMRQSALARAIDTLPYFEKAEQTRETLATLADEYLSYFTTGAWEGSTLTASSPDDDIPF